MKAALMGASTFALMTTIATHASAQAAPDAAVDAIIVTGTRTTGLRVQDSPAPIQVLDATALTRVGQPDLVQALAQNVPSFTAQAFGGDTANLTLSARLRGLSPNHALVLVDGKRRHTTSNLAVLGGPYQGGASADLNFISVGAIDHIEVLQEGASAQYGTDAVAGVINIILKKSARGGSLTATGGEYFDGGGLTSDVIANFGFAPTDKSFLNLTLENKYHGFSFRGDIDPRVQNTPFNTGSSGRLSSYPEIAQAKGYPYLNRITGDARYRLNTVAINAGYDVAEGVQLYAFGTYGEKDASAYENYRVPNRVVGAAGQRPFPLGFSPREAINEKDFQVTGGLRGQAAGWTWDIATTYGRDEASVNVLDSANASLFLDTGFTPLNFHAGDFISSQWTSTLDITKDFDVSMATPLTVAVGAEYREDTYEIKPGDPASRYKEGSQSYPGFALTDAGSHDRSNEAVYIDFAVSPVEALKLDLAGRYEHFSDFGDATVGKLTGRYDFVPAFGVRGTISTGFRAPTLAESYYSATNVGPDSAFVQLPPNAPAARLVGVNGLKAEKSTNYSGGFVFHPVSRLTATVDAYQISLRDRIVGSGTLYGSGGTPTLPAVRAAIVANGNVLDPTVTFTGINIFTNGIDTRTRGVEAVVTYSSDLADWGRIDWSLSGNYNTTKITKIAAPPPQLQGASLFDAAALSYLEDASPKFRAVLGAVWNRGPFSVTVRESIYGKSSQLDTYDGATYYRTTIGTKGITDLEGSYRVTPSVRLTVGANNLFNVYPDKMNAAYRKENFENNSNGYVTLYPTFSSFGINGGYYYGRASFTF